MVHRLHLPLDKNQVVTIPKLNHKSRKADCQFWQIKSQLRQITISWFLSLQVKEFKVFHSLCVTPPSKLFLLVLDTSKAQKIIKYLSKGTLSKDKLFSKVLFSLPGRTEVIFHLLFWALQAGFVVLCQELIPWRAQLSSKEIPGNKIRCPQKSSAANTLGTGPWEDSQPTFSVLFLERLGLGQLGSCISRHLTLPSESTSQEAF